MRAIYTAYLTGSTGSSIALFVIGDGVIAGVDVGGMVYDGQLTEHDGSFEGSLVFQVPKQAQLITGLSGGDATARFDMPIKLPRGFDDGRVIRIETPVGPVNAKFEKIRDLL